LEKDDSNDDVPFIESIQKNSNLATPFSDPRQQNISFFENEFARPGGGIMYLATQAQSRISYIVPGQFDDNDTDLYLLLTQLCLSVSNENKSLLAQLIRLVQEQAIKNYIQSQQPVPNKFGQLVAPVLQVPNTPSRL
jgi:hypothetical protein